ncbi:MAG: methyltransferase domain-containing protein [Proteobacteria bacterium]|nr:methyltransferase domain-containing protein [Pseudomonadota bacterium]
MAELPLRTSDPLDAWLSTPLGQTLLASERAALALALEDVFGQHLLQVGYWGPPDAFLPLARLPGRSLIVDPSHRGDCVCHAGALGIASRSVDAVLLPHTLEFEPEPREVLREVERVLTADGHLLIVGFAPLGAWGLRHWLSSGGFPPGLRQLWSPRRLRDWLRLLGFQIVSTRHCVRTLPLERCQGGVVAEGLARLGQRLGDRFGAVYVLKARKRVCTLTPIRLRRGWRRSVAGNAVEIT